MVEGSHSEAYVDKFEGMACPRWEQPSGCAIRLLREGKAEGVSANTSADNVTEWDGNASTFQLTCNVCGLTVANDPYERSNIDSIDSETGVAEMTGGVLSKTGARRGREDAINRKLINEIYDSNQVAGISIKLVKSFDDGESKFILNLEMGAMGHLAFEEKSILNLEDLTVATEERVAI